MKATAHSRGSSATLAALLLLPWLIYWPAAGGPFLFDDLSAIANNPDVQGLHATGEMLRFWERGGVSYRPVRYLSFAIDWTLGGGSPLVFHLTNIVLHVLCGLLLWRLLAGLLAPEVAATAALLFLVHPIQTEAVAYISGRKDLLCALFYLLALHGSLRAVRAGGLARFGWSAVFFAAAGASYLSKEMALTLPAAVLLLDGVTQTDRGGVRSRWRDILRGRAVFYGFLASMGLGALVYKTVLAPATKIPFNLLIDPWRNIPLALQTVSFHVRKLFWPWPQVADLRGLFPQQLGEGRGWGSFWNGGGLAVTLIGLALLAVLVRVARRLPPDRRGAMSAGLAFFLVALLPVANLIPLNEPAAEHFLYLPMAGMAVAIAAWAGPLYSKPARFGRKGVAIVLLALAGLGAAAGVRSAVWRSAERLWSSVLAVNDGSERAYNNLGLALLEAGDTVAARRALQEALRRGPLPSRQTAANLMVLDRSEGDLQAAQRVGELALRAHPDDPLLLSLQGGILLELNLVDQAVQTLERVAQLPAGPSKAAETWARDRGVAWFLRGNPARGLSLLEEAARQKPRDPSILTDMGACLLELDRLQEAETVLSEAVALPDASGMTHRNLAVAYLRLDRPADAARQLELAAGKECPIPPSLAKAVAEAAHRDSSTVPDRAP